MAFTNKTYYEIRLIQVPNLEKENREERLNEYIALYEDEYLDKMLGVKLKNEFLAGLEATPTIEDRWLRLRDGYEYEVSGIVYRWQGFVNDKKLSPLANDTYSKLATDNQFKMTDPGETTPIVENGSVVAPYYRVSKVWNEMVKLNIDLLNFLYEFEEDYLSWDIPHKTPLLSIDNGIGL